MQQFDSTEEAISPAKSDSILITYPFPISAANGGARATREIAVHLSKLGCQVTILWVCCQPLKQEWPRQKAPVTAHDKSVEELLNRHDVRHIRVPPNRWHRKLDGLAIRAIVKAYLKNEKPGLVLSYYHEAAFLSGLLKKRNIPFGFISTWQSYEFALKSEHAKNPFKRALNKWLTYQTVIRPHHRGEVFFASSAFTKRELQQVLGIKANKILVCYLGVGPSFHQIQREKPEKISRIIFFARLVPHKGVEDAIKALGTIAALGYREWEFRVFGTGDQQKVQRLAAQNGIADQVVVAGPLDDTTLQKELALAHLALMPSHFEAFGLSNAEAQAAGLPVIAYASGSVPEIVVDGETGWLAPFRKVEQLAACLVEAIENPIEACRRGLAGRERMAIYFTWSKTARIILDYCASRSEP